MPIDNAFRFHLSHFIEERNGEAFTETHIRNWIDRWNVSEGELKEELKSRGFSYDPHSGAIAPIQEVDQSIVVMPKVIQVDELPVPRKPGPKNNSDDEPIR